MQQRKRSDALWRQSAGCRLAVATALFLVGGGAGCGLAPDMEDVVNPPPFHYEVQDLTPAALEDRMKEIDTYFAEPRTPAKVHVSYDTSLKSISSVNGYGALWRGARACAWLADNHPERSKREEYAVKGIAMGREAVDKASTRVESYYYLALSYAFLAQARGDASKDLLARMRAKMDMARQLDEKFDFCGPDRFLGQLMVELDPYPLRAVGSMEQGLVHLKRATDVCPEYGENHLVYAKALIQDDETELARAALMKAISCPKPPDRTAEHEAWLEEAGRLLPKVEKDTY